MKSQERSTQHQAPVLIIGAGIAGLAAAYELERAGIRTLTLEAGSKVGGRLRTDRSLGFAFDEGASWIHGPEGNPVTELAGVAGAKTFLTDDQKMAVYDANGSPYAADHLASAEEEFEYVLNRIRKKAKPEQSVKEVFAEEFPEYVDDRLCQYFLSADLEFDTGGDIERLSGKYFYDDEEFKGKDLIITNGYDRLANYLAQSLDIRLEERVKAIYYAEEEVLVITESTTYRAAKVIVAVPLGVLKQNAIEFTPALPEKKQTAIQALEMGTVNKFVLVWEKAFWDPAVQYIGYTPEAKGKFNFFMNMLPFTGANALMTFAFGQYSITTEQMKDEDLVEAIMSHLQMIYGKDIPLPASFKRTCWNSDTNTFGSYSFATKGIKTRAFDWLAREVDDKLFFAGEHTSREYRGTVHGALLSGVREAEKILEALES
ncbi:FAD-dependent oxidoreductase [Rapidithrix thailandica]|uniref:Tryptophan 2-monooxygenase n=1 Tax=Rapidithrix thailandica TaxID=413964 RepID=A0AAW9S4R3_9BACT